MAYPMHGMHPYVDPNYKNWYFNYAWFTYTGWDHGTIYRAIDTKIARIAYSLAGMLVKDKLPKVKYHKPD